MQSAKISWFLIQNWIFTNSFVAKDIDQVKKQKKWRFVCFPYFFNAHHFFTFSNECHNLSRSFFPTLSQQIETLWLALTDALLTVDESSKDPSEFSAAPAVENPDALLFVKKLSSGIGKFVIAPPASTLLMSAKQNICVQSRFQAFVVALQWMPISNRCCVLFRGTET